MKTTSHHLHFQIHGDFLTNHVRNLMLEGNWMHALKTLSDGLVDTDKDRQGISLEHCISILGGYKRLEGVNTLTLKEEYLEITKSYRERLQRLYGAIVNIPGCKKHLSWYMPYAYVTRYGESDMFANYGRQMGDIPYVTRTRTRLVRATYYMLDRENDIAYYPTKNECEEEKEKGFDLEGCHPVYLLQSCDSPPFWFEVNRNIHKAILNALACKTMKEFGANDTKRIEEREEEEAIEVTNNSLRNDSSITFDIAKQMAQSTGLDPNAVSSMLDKITHGADNSSKPEEDTKLAFASGWVLRNGDYYGVEYYKHPEMARRILLHVVGIAEEEMPEDCEIDADNRGWLRVQKSADGHSVAFLMGSDKKASKSQLETVVRYCEKYKVPFPADLIYE